MQIHCIVKPGSKNESILRNPDGSLRIKIKELPEKGKANEYLIKFIARKMSIPQSAVQIISGFTSSHKRINIVADEKIIRKKLSTL